MAILLKSCRSDFECIWMTPASCLQLLRRISCSAYLGINSSLPLTVLALFFLYFDLFVWLLSFQLYYTGYIYINYLKISFDMGKGVSKETQYSVLCQIKRHGYQSDILILVDQRIQSSEQNLAHQHHAGLISNIILTTCYLGWQNVLHMASH